MATNKGRACARKMTKFHERLASGFGRKEAKRHSLVDLKGLLLCAGRKNVERMALRFAEPPELTLPLALELMTATLSRPTLTETDAMRLTEHHPHRNRVS